MDCGVNLRNAVLDVYNNTTHEKYRRKLWEISHQHDDVSHRVHELGWSILTWCLIHVKQAVIRFAHKELSETAFFTKSEMSEIAASLHAHVRLAHTPNEVASRKLVVELIAGSPSLQIVLADPSAAALLRISENVVVLTLGSGEISARVLSLAAGCGAADL